MKVRLIVVALTAIVLTLASCSKQPKDVLGKEDMISLLVDIHKGEGLIDLQRGRYSNDSLRKVVKQSIYHEHGVTAEQVDSSLMWYGNHIEDYLEIYDEVISRLESEMSMDDNNDSHKYRFAEGDSADVWVGAKSYRLYGDMPVRNIVYEIERGSDWRAGDNFTLRYKASNLRSRDQRLQSAVYVAYDDGSKEYVTGYGQGEIPASIRLVTDSTKMVSRIYGFISIDTDRSQTVYLDSVALVRTRLDRANYNKRFGQKQIRKIEPKAPEEPNDTLSSATES